MKDNNMKIHDISVTISEDMPVWPNDPSVSITQTRAIRRGNSCNVTQLEMGSHTGTHIDAPYHFEDIGLKIDQLDLGTLVGKARVFHLAGNDNITLAKVTNLDLEGVERVLFKTKNSDRWKYGLKSFTEDFITLENDAAKHLVKAGIKLVGIDYLSIETFGTKVHDTHHTLLSKDVVIIEGLNLARVTPGDYELTALPLKIKNGDGSPARVILREIAAK